MPDVRDCQTYKHSDIIVLAETHLRASNFDASLHIDGYENHRFDNEKHTGGVLLYTKHDKYGIANHAVKGLDIIIYAYILNEKWEKICFLYRNPSIKIEILQSSINEIIQSYGNDVVFVGDFNYKSDCLPITLKCLFDSHNYKQLVSAPTQQSGNTIDHVYSSNANRATTHVLQSYFSDHYPIHIQLKASPQETFVNYETDTYGARLEVFTRKPPCK
jgi:exonuclease III